MASLADLPAGHTFDPIRFTAGAGRVRAYLDATGDRLGLYEEHSAVPPLAVAAFALGALMALVDLPDGTLHGNEWLQAHALVPQDAELECATTVTRKAVRAGMVFTTLEFVISMAGAPVVTARSNILFPAEAA